MDPLIDKKIKALYMWYDVECNRQKLNHKQKMSLLKLWIDEFIKYEEYEIAEAFRIKKVDEIKKYAIKRRSKRRFFRKAILYIYKAKKRLFGILK